MNSKLAASGLRRLVSRLYFTATVRAFANQPAEGLLTGNAGFFEPSRSVVPSTNGVLWARTLTSGAVKGEGKSVTDSTGGRKEKKEIVSNWKVAPAKMAKEDGAEWNWRSFRVCGPSGK